MCWTRPPHHRNTSCKACSAHDRTMCEPNAVVEFGALGTGGAKHVRNSSETTTSEHVSDTCLTIIRTMEHTLKLICSTNFADNPRLKCAMVRRITKQNPAASVLVVATVDVSLLAILPVVRRALRDGVPILARSFADGQQVL